MESEYLKIAKFWSQEQIEILNFELSWQEQVQKEC